MKKIEVGQSIWVKEYYNGDELAELKVTKVGRQYFYADSMKFDKETFECVRDIGGYAKAYLSEQEYLDEIEAIKLNTKLRDYLGRNTTSLEVLKAIEILLFPTPNKLVCCKCGSENVLVQTWVDPNTNIIDDIEDVDNTMCLNCEANVELELKD